MSSQPTDPPTDGGTVVPLRAVDVGTEVRADESAGPSYVDLSSGEAQRRPLIPQHWRTREAAATHVRLAAAGTGTAPPITGCGRRPTSSRPSASPCGAWPASWVG